jgi:hypothetical protein
VSRWSVDNLIKATSHGGEWPLTWVGVAGFEPAASSSRRQSDTRAASLGAACTCWLMSTGVHERPSQTAWVITHFVTQAGRDQMYWQADDRLSPSWRTFTPLAS